MNEAQRRVVVTGVGAISPLGDSPAAIHEALCEGRSGIRPIELFKTDGLPTREAGEIAWKPRDYLGNANLRPVDRTGQLVIVAAQLALEASGWTAELRGEHEVGLVLGTMFGSVHTISAFDLRALKAGPRYAKPLDFANTVINAATGQTAIWHDLRGINSTITGGATAGLQALAYAVEMIRNGRAEVLLAGGGEELCFESFCGFSRTGMLCAPQDGTSECPVPFDARRNGFRLGEGSALLVLEEAESARRRGATILAEIRGHGSAYDCSRGSDPQPATAAVERAIRQALDDAGTAADAVDAVSTAANGSVRGDRHEALGIGAVFGERSGRLPVTAVKSMLGEALGASGAFQTVAMLESMRSGVLPGIRGLEALEDGIPLALAAPQNREAELRCGLVNALGHDGNACALVVERRGEEEV
ncbi:MAG: beta-ketoacyl-[acyl-carrier-protein] synthase family protein [bacterium]|nr:beta-ketoacyl-[acyl-carrier-protein] synthase family protein [bacterium]